MNPIRLNLIRTGIAEVLDQCAPYLVPETKLFNQLNMTLRPPATLSEFEHVIGRLEMNRQILRVGTEEGNKAKLTELGKAELLT